MHDANEMRAMLRAYRDFGECVVVGVAWTGFGTTVEVTLDYAWKPDGSVRGDDEPRVLVKLSFRLVQELEIRNALRPVMVEDPSVIGWGLNEVSRVSIGRDARSAAYDGLPTLFHHAVFWREEGPWIQVVFAGLEVSETAGPPGSPGSGVRAPSGGS